MKEILLVEFKNLDYRDSDDIQSIVETLKVYLGHDYYIIATTPSVSVKCVSTPELLHKFECDIDQFKNAGVSKDILIDTIIKQYRNR